MLAQRSSRRDPDPVRTGAASFKRVLGSTGSPPHEPQTDRRVGQRLGNRRLARWIRGECVHKRGVEIRANPRAQRPLNTHSDLDGGRRARRPVSDDTRPKVHAWPRTPRRRREGPVEPAPHSGVAGWLVITAGGAGAAGACPDPKDPYSTATASSTRDDTRYPMDASALKPGASQSGTARVLPGLQHPRERAWPRVSEQRPGHGALTTRRSRVLWGWPGTTGRDAYAPPACAA